MRSHHLNILERRVVLEQRGDRPPHPVIPAQCVPHASTSFFATVAPLSSTLFECTGTPFTF